jgi:hypothetical protein
MRKQDTWPERPRRNKLKVEDVRLVLLALLIHEQRLASILTSTRSVSFHYFLHPTITTLSTFTFTLILPLTHPNVPPRDAQDGELVHYSVTCLYQLYDAQDQLAPVFDSTLSSVSLVTCVDIKLQSMKC